MNAPPASSAELGAGAEELASRYLVRQGLLPLARNYRCRHGEIDLIMRDGDTIAFVEVRLRNRTDYGSAAESVDARKRAHILSTAEHYLKRHATLLARCRFDVVSVQRSRGAHRLQWIRDAFGA